MNAFFTSVSQTITGGHGRASRNLKALHKNLETTLLPLVAHLNQTVAAESRDRRFHLTITPGKNPWDQQDNLGISIGHFTLRESKAALFFNKNPRKTNTPEGISFTEVNAREYKFSVSQTPTTSGTDNARSQYHFTAWTKVSDPEAPRESGLRVLQNATTHIAAKPQAEFTQDVATVIKSAMTYFEYKLNRPIVPPDNTPSSARGQPKGLRQREATMARIY